MRELYIIHKNLGKLKYVSPSCIATENKHSPLFLVILRMPPRPEDETTCKKVDMEGQ